MEMTLPASLPLFYNIQEAIHSGSPFNLSPTAFQYLEDVYIEQYSETQRIFLHNAMLLIPDLAWKIRTEQDLQLITGVMKDHKGLHHLSLNIDSLMRFDELATTLQSAGPVQLAIERTSGVDISQILVALQHAKRLTQLELLSSPEPYEYEALACTMKNEFIVEVVFTIEDLFNAEAWQPLIPVLSAHKSLQDLKFYSSYGDGAGFQALGEILEKNRSIQSVTLEDLGYIPVTHDMTVLCTGLVHNTTLKKLHIGQVKAGAASELFKYLANDQIKLTELSLRDAQLLEYAMKVLNESLRTNTTLTSLCFSGGFTDGTCQLLCQGLKRNNSLKHLKLTIGYFRLRGVTAICDWLSQNDSLTSLELTRCHIDAEQIQLIAQMLAKNKSLTELDLTINTFTKKGINNLCQSLAYNTTIKRLMMSSGKQGEDSDGLTGVKNMLIHNKTLRHFEVSVNFNSAEEVDSICEGLKHNDSLPSIKLVQATHIPYNFINLMNKLNEAVLCNFALDRFIVDNVEHLAHLIQRNRALKSEIKYKVAVLSHNIARSDHALAILPREMWVQILSSITHPGMDEFKQLVRDIFDSYL